MSNSCRMKSESWDAAIHPHWPVQLEQHKHSEHLQSINQSINHLHQSPAKRPRLATKLKADVVINWFLISLVHRAKWKSIVDCFSPTFDSSKDFPHFWCWSCLPNLSRPVKLDGDGLCSFVPACSSKSLWNLPRILWESKVDHQLRLWKKLLVARFAVGCY